MVTNDWCITFINSLEPDQARQNVRSDLDLYCLTLPVGDINWFILEGRLFGPKSGRTNCRDCSGSKLCVTCEFHILTHAISGTAL